MLGQILAGVPKTPQRFLSRPRLLDALDAGRDSRLIILSGPCGSGKSTLLSDWLCTRASRDRMIVWVSLDDSSRSRAGFWHRVVQAFISSKVASADGPLGGYISGGVGLDSVPGLLLAELSTFAQRVELVLDDLHLVEDGAVDEIAWLVERSNYLQVLATTHRRGRLEAPEIMVRLEPVVITGRDLAFTLDETVQTLEQNGVICSHEEAAIIHEVTAGHPLATRIAITSLALVKREPSSASEFDRDAVIDWASRSGREMLPAFSNPEHKALALRLSLAPSVDIQLASELTGLARAESILRHFEKEGLGDFRGYGDDAAFAFHAVIGLALEREAVATIDPAVIIALRRTAAQSLSHRKDALGALRLYVRLGDHHEMWPVIAQNFSELISHHQKELEDVLRQVPPTRLHELGSLAIALAILLSERQGLPSTEVLHLADAGIAALKREPLSAEPLQRFWALLSTFAGHRAARRYRQAAEAGDALISHVNLLPSENRAFVDSAIGAGHLQIMITYILVGRIDDALTLARRLAHDPHAGRQQHRASLTAYIYAVRGDMREAASLAKTVTHARFENWRVTVPAVGWHGATALIQLEGNEPRKAFETISALDSRLGALENWPYLLWIKGMTRLASPHPELGADELALSLASHESRPATAFTLDMLAGLRSDLYLAVGQIDRAHRILAKRHSECASITLPLARLMLAEHRLDEAKLVLAPLQWGAGLSPRHKAESLLLQAVVDLRSARRADALKSARRALSLLSRYGLRMPLIMVPQQELYALVSEELPVHLALFEHLPNPFGEISTPNLLSPREHEVLIALTTAKVVTAIASDLFVSVNTIKSQLRSIYRKLGVSSRDEAIRVARIRGHLSE